MRETSGIPFTMVFSMLTTSAGEFPLKDFEVVKLTLKNQRLFIQSVLGGYSALTNEFITNALGSTQFYDELADSSWDRNFSSNVFEVVNEDTNPVLQIIYSRPNQITINGVFVVEFPSGERIPLPNGKSAVGPGRAILFSFGTNSEFTFVAGTNFWDTRNRVKGIVKDYKSFRKFKYHSYDHLGQYVDDK